MYTYLKAIINLPNGVKFFFLTELIIGIGGGIWGLNFNFLMKSKGFSLSEIGKIIAVSPLVTALFSLPAGYLCDRSGYKRSMIAGCASRAAAMFIAFLADSTGLIYLSRILTGIGDSFVLTSSYPYITSMVTEEKRSMVYSLLFSCMMFSSFLGSTAGGFLLKVIKDSDRYEISIIIAFIIMFVVTIMRCFLPKASVKREKGEKARIYIPRQKFLFAYLLNDFIGFISYFIGTSMLNLILRDVMKMSDSFTGITLGLSTIMSSVAVFIVPHVTSRFRGTKVGSLALWILTGVYAAMSWTHGYVFALFVIVTVLLSNMLVGLIDSPMFNKIPDIHKGGFSGLKLLITNTGISIASSGAGYLLSFTKGYTYIFFISSVLSFVQLLLLQFGFRKQLDEE